MRLWLRLSRVDLFLHGDNVVLCGVDHLPNKRTLKSAIKAVNAVVCTQLDIVLIEGINVICGTVVVKVEAANVVGAFTACSSYDDATCLRHPCPPAPRRRWC